MDKKILVETSARHIHLTQENFLVRVDGVDHQVEQALALGLELFLGHVYASNIISLHIYKVPASPVFT